MNDDAHNATEISPGPARGRLARFLARSENFVAGPRWKLEALFLAVLVSILFSARVDDRLWGELNGNRWFPAYYQKIDHPLLDVARINAPYNHEAKLNFRLTVPVILHVLHVPPTWLWVLPALAACGTCALIFLSCAFAFRVTRDRVCGLYTALAVSCTYIGSFAFTMYYDSIALSQLVLAMLPGTPWFFKALLVFTASFTDERAFLASPFLLVQVICSNSTETFRAKLLRPESLAVVAGMAAYVIGRLALEEFAGLTSPHEGIGWVMFVANRRFLPVGFWLALKGGWLLVAVAAGCLWLRGRLPALVIFFGATLLSVSSGFFVDDVARSVAYVFPAFLIALMVAAACETTARMRIYCLLAFAISLVTGNFNVWRGQLTWFQPAAVDICNYVLHGLFQSIARP